MKHRHALAALSLIVALGAAAVAQRTITLPTSWRIDAPDGPAAIVGTMPQGIALSPDGTQLAVVDAGVNAPDIRILDASTLQTVKRLDVKDAFGAPVWSDATHVVVAGAGLDGVLVADAATGSVSVTSTGAKWPVAVALSRDRAHIAIANDGDGTITLADFPALAQRQNIAVGAHPGPLAFSADGSTVYVTLHPDRTLVAIDVATHNRRTLDVGLHPSALALSPDGATLAVAAADDDRVTLVDTRSLSVRSGIDVGLDAGRTSGSGASPNALAFSEDGATLYASLGAENAVAVMNTTSVLARIPVGWYPDGLALSSHGTLFVSDGKGEHSQPNPEFNPFGRRSPGYVGATRYGSVRAVDLAAVRRDDQASTQAVIANAAPQWSAPNAGQTIIRPNGPIKHVIYVIKENRSYDQVLGDIPGANGDPKLTAFGERITPNQHAIARRFGIFDNAYANSQVSADGHNWTDEAFANDYVERNWPPNYGGRRALYDFQDTQGAPVPHNGFLWDAAARAGISFRDYGEDIEFPDVNPTTGTAHDPTLAGHFNPRYVTFNLTIPDQARFTHWAADFADFVHNGDLPALEIVYLPSDHTAGTRPGARTPFAYVAENDYVFGQLVDAVSHSPFWKDTVIFSVEDDAQNGPDHVDAQRTTFYVASPYARGGVTSVHYTQAGVLHTIELLLGLKPLSIYDATAEPMYAAFSNTPDLSPFRALPPNIDTNAKNTADSYGAAMSAKLDFSHADAADPRVLTNILEHLPQPAR